MERDIVFLRNEKLIILAERLKDKLSDLRRILARELEGSGNNPCRYTAWLEGRISELETTVKDILRMEKEA